MFEREGRVLNDYIHSLTTDVFDESWDETRKLFPQHRDHEFAHTLGAPHQFVVFDCLDSGQRSSAGHGTPSKCGKIFYAGFLKRLYDFFGCCHKARYPSRDQ